MSEDPSVDHRRNSDARRTALGLAPLPGDLIPRVPAEDLRRGYPGLVTADATVWVGEGWRALVTDALDALAGAPVRVSLVREHCAGMQLMIGPASRWTEASIELAHQVGRQARERSVITCEACGQPGRPRIPGPGVRCDEHRDWR